MLGLLGQLGILGCVIAAVGVGVAVIGTAVSIGLSVSAANEAADAEDRAIVREQEAMDKAENSAKATKATQKRQMAANLARTRGQVGSSIAYERLLAKRAKRKTAKTKAAIDSSGSGPKYKKGTPSKQV